MQPVAHPQSLNSLFISACLLLAALLAILTYQNAKEPLHFSGTALSSATYQPHTDAQQRSVALPYFAPLSEHAINRGHYTLTFTSEPLKEPALVLHSTQDSAKVWLNQQLLTEVGQTDLIDTQIPPRNRHVPTLIRIPPALLQTENTLELDVISNWETSLGPVSYGEYEQLRKEVEWALIWRVDFLWAGVAFALPMSLFFLAVWFFYKQSTVYLWLGLVMGIWPFNTFVMTFTNTAIDRQLVTLIQEPSNLLYATAMVCFTFVYRGTYLSWIKTLWLISAAVYLFFVLFITNPQWPLPEGLGLGVLYGWIGIASLFSTYVIIANAYERKTFRSVVMAMAGVIVEIIAIWDILPLLGVLPGFPITFVVQWGVITVLICYSSVMSFELAMALKKSNAFNETLQTEVNTQTKKLTEQYENIVELERQKVVSDERSRLISDMHDGTSGQLTSLIAGLKTGKLTQQQAIQLLEYCVRDLRLILDSMNVDATDDLARALAMFSGRVRPLLEAKEITLNWDTLSLPEDIQLSPHQLLNIFRILQEAITNIIKHANAGHVSLRVYLEDQSLHFKVRDNGQGMSGEEQAQLGYGKKSMVARALSLGGSLDIKSQSHEFTELSLNIPLARLSQTRLP